MSQDRFESTETGDGVTTTLLVDSNHVVFTVRQSGDRLNRAVIIDGIESARELRRQLDAQIGKAEAQQSGVVAYPRSFVASCGRV